MKKEYPDSIFVNSCDSEVKGWKGTIKSYLDDFAQIYGRMIGVKRKILPSTMKKKAVPSVLGPTNKMREVCGSVLEKIVRAGHVTKYYKKKPIVFGESILMRQIYLRNIQK